MGSPNAGLQDGDAQHFANSHPQNKVVSSLQEGGVTIPTLRIIGLIYEIVVRQVQLWALYQSETCLINYT